MKIKGLSFLVSLFMFNLSWAGGIEMVATSSGVRWNKVEDYVVKRKASSPYPLVVREDLVYQEIDGFGASFNEMGWHALLNASESDRKAVMKELFDPVDGCRFSICRVSIGANDFAKGYYSLNDHPFDYEMKHFSIERDKEGIIPYIRSAMEFNPDIKIWGSPWTPPLWMKQNKHYGGRSVNDNWGQIYGAPMDDIGPLNRIVADSITLEAYARYFVKYVESYRAEGINLYAIQPQNEVFANQFFPSCLWEADVLEDFMANYLLPAIEKVSPGVEVWLGTFNSDTIGFVDRVMMNPRVADRIKGIGVQWKGLNMLEELSRKYVNKRMMQTESECNNGSNDWFTAEHTYRLLVKAFKDGANSYMYWNMILDELGFSYWLWRQNSMVSVNRFTGKVVYNPEFHVMKHFSHFIDPGARRIGLQNDLDEDIAFRNPDGKTVIITANTTDTVLDREIVHGKKVYHVKIAPGSFYTICLK